MLLTFALVVLFGSFLVIFSDEFIKVFKKLFAIKGIKLFLPLLIASWLIYTFVFWFLWLIFYLHETLQDVLVFLKHIMPFQQGAESIVFVFLLTTLSVVPVLIIDIISRRNHYVGYRYPYVTSGIIWILCVFLLIIM